MRRYLLPNKRLSYSIRRYFVDEFFFRQMASLPDNTFVLDLGGHYQTKRGRFDIGDYDFHVITANIVTDKGTTVQADANRIPFEDSCFDVVICAELLEHVYDPRLVVQEVSRVLKTEGILLVTVPFLFHIHADPYDYGRYTTHYWEKTLADAGFQQIQIEYQGYYHSVLLNFAEQYFNQLKIPQPFGRPFRWIIARLFIAPAKRWTLWYERKLHTRNHTFFKSFTTGFGIVGVKQS